MTTARPLSWTRSATRSVWLTLVLLALVAPALLIGCGGDDEPGPTTGGTTGNVGQSSGVGGERTFNALTMDDIEQLCEWSIRSRGGPGADLKCDGVVLQVETLGECQNQLGRLSSSVKSCLTVAKVEACMTAQGKEPCTPPSQLSPCDAFNACLAE